MSTFQEWYDSATPEQKAEFAQGITVQQAPVEEQPEDWQATIIDAAVEKIRNEIMPAMTPMMGAAAKTTFKSGLSDKEQVLMEEITKDMDPQALFNGSQSPVIVSALQDAARWRDSQAKPEGGEGGKEGEKGEGKPIETSEKVKEGVEFVKKELGAMGHGEIDDEKLAAKVEAALEGA